MKRILVTLILLSIAIVAYAAVVTDDFNRADGDVGTNWTDVTAAGKLQIATNQLSTVDNSNRVNTYTASALASANYYVQTKIINAGASGNVQVYARTAGTGATRDGYSLDLSTTGTITWTIGRSDDGAFTSLTSGTTTFSANDVLRLEVSGSTLTAKKNGSTLGSTTDATYSAAGTPGVGIFNGSGTNQLIDDFEAGDLGAANVFSGPFGGPFQ